MPPLIVSRGKGQKLYRGCISQRVAETHWKALNNKRLYFAVGRGSFFGRLAVQKMSRSDRERRGLSSVQRRVGLPACNCRFGMKRKLMRSLYLTGGDRLANA